MDGFQRALVTALRDPWDTRDIPVALAALELALSPQLLNSPEFPAMVEQMLPLFPQREGNLRTTCGQWDADIDHDKLDRLGSISAPTLVVGGEQDLLTPPWHCQAVANAIAGAQIQIFTGPGSSHALSLERPEEFIQLVADFLVRHPLPAMATDAMPS